jgi:hypothetical protein
LNVPKRQGMSTENIAEIDKFTTCVTQMNDALYLKLKNIEETETVKGDSTGKEEIKDRVIDTRFDGKLIGTPDGDVVVVKDITGKKTAYRHDANKWIRDEDTNADLDDIEPEAESVAGAAQDAKRKEKSLQKISAKVEQTIKQVEQLRGDAAKNIELASYVAKQDGPGSQSTTIFLLALNNQQQALVKSTKIMSILKDKFSTDPAIADQYIQMKEKLETVQGETDKMKEKMLEFIKDNPSNVGLGILLDENQAGIPTKTKNKKPLKTERIDRTGVMHADFMDEHLMPITGRATPYMIHTHYAKPGALQKENTACHIIWEVNGKRTQIPLSKEIQQRIV